MKKIQIRHKTFETNSSSSHSFFIPSQAFLRDIPYVNDNGVVDINIDFKEEWGWSWDSFNDFYSKINYIAVAMAYSLSSHSADQVLSPVRYIRDEKVYVIDQHLFEAMMSRITKIILETSGANKVDYHLIGLSEHVGNDGVTVYNNTVSSSSLGYIDHESAHLMSASSVSALSDKEIATALFDPSSVLITGNDNDSTEEESKSIFYIESSSMSGEVKAEFKEFILANYFYPDQDF